MKIKIVFLIAAVTMMSYSCSTDEENNEMMEETVSNLVGEWNLTDVNFEGQSDIELNLAAEIIDRLADEQCYLVTFEFNADGTATATDRINFVEVNAGPTGLDVPCPTQSNTESSTWSLAGNQLTFINAEMEEETIEISLEGNTMILAGEAVDAQNYAGAQAIFTKS